MIENNLIPIIVTLGALLIYIIAHLYDRKLTREREDRMNEILKEWHIELEKEKEKENQQNKEG